jgi:hypothetical protein
MENFRITNHTKYLLEFVGNQVRMFPWEGTQVHQSGGMILYGQHPAHKNTKGIALPQRSKVDNIQLEPITKRLGKDGFAAPLKVPGYRILLHAGEACLQIDPDMFLADIPICIFAVYPCSLETHVAISPMPFINCLKYILSASHNSTNNHISFFILSHPFDNCAWFQVAWRKNLLKMILMCVLVPFLVLATKMQQRIPLVTRGHAPNLNTHLQI